jgi:hypothetical protein
MIALTGRRTALALSIGGGVLLVLSIAAGSYAPLLSPSQSVGNALAFGLALAFWFFGLLGGSFALGLGVALLQGKSILISRGRKESKLHVWLAVIMSFAALFLSIDLQNRIKEDVIRQDGAETVAVVTDRRLGKTGKHGRCMKVHYEYEIPSRRIEASRCERKIRVGDADHIAIRYAVHYPHVHTVERPLPSFAPPNPTETFTD